MKYHWDESDIEDYREPPEKLALKNILWLVLLIVGSISIGYALSHYGSKGLLG